MPSHQTLSHAQTRRFVDQQIFERLFMRSVALCREHDLTDGSHLSVDGFHAEASAALESLRASLEPVEGGAETETAGDAEHEAKPRPQLALCEPSSGPTPKRRSSNKASVSRTDPDAKLRGKPGQRPHLVYRGQVAVDPKARCIISCLGEQADGHEGDALSPITDRARFACPELASVSADSGFAAERVWREQERRGIAAFVPPQPTMLPADGEPRTEAQRQALRARERCKSEHGIWAHKRRMADAEGVIAELKNQGTMERALCRGTPLFHVQLLVDCAAINLKRIAAHAGEAAEGRAAQPASGTGAALGALSGASQASLSEATPLQVVVGPPVLFRGAAKPDSGGSASR